MGLKGVYSCSAWGVVSSSSILVLKLDCSGIVVGRRLLLSDPVVGVENVTWTEGKIYLIKI